MKTIKKILSGIPITLIMGGVLYMVIWAAIEAARPAQEQREAYEASFTTLGCGTCGDDSCKHPQ